MPSGERRSHPTWEGQGQRRPTPVGGSVPCRRPLSAFSPPQSCAAGRARLRVCPMRYRTVLFCPANMVSRANRLLSAGSDVVVLDLEDGVGLDQKAAARAALGHFAAELRRGSSGAGVFARINDVRSEFYDDDLSALGPELDG